MGNAVITIDGHLGKEPEFKTTAQGLEYAHTSVAVNHYKGRDRESTTSWFKITVFGKAVESLRDWRKGDYVIVSGDLELKTWTGQDGEKQQNAEIAAKSWTNVSKMQRARGVPEDGQPAPPPPRSTKQAAPPPPVEDDLPF